MRERSRVGSRPLGGRGNDIFHRTSTAKPKSAMFLSRGKKRALLHGEITRNATVLRLGSRSTVGRSEQVRAYALTAADRAAEPLPRRFLARTVQ